MPDGSQGVCPADHTLQVAFVVDVTGSMGTYIRDVKNNIAKMVDQIVSSNKRQLRIELAFVGYRDLGERDEFLGFTSSVDDFRLFVSGVRASGGGDFPEDVLGGLDIASRKLQWGGGTKMIFHIGDAPHHGYRFAPWGSFGYGKEERAQLPRPAEDILDELCAKEIDYYFYKIASHTSQMEKVFRRIWDACGTKRQPLQIADLSSGYDATALVATTVKSVEASLALTLIDADRTDGSHLSLRERLELFYRKHAPAMVGSEKLEATISRYAGKDEPALFAKLEMKYGTCCPGLPCCELAQPKAGCSVH